MTDPLKQAREALAEVVEILDMALMIGLPTLPPGADGPAVKARAAIAAIDALPAQQAAPAWPVAIEALAHRIAWRYKKSSDPHHSDTYTFNRATLLQFAAALAAPAAPAGWQPAGFDKALGQYAAAARAMDSDGMREGYVALRSMLSGWPSFGPIRCWCCASPNWPVGSGGIEHDTEGWRWVPVEATEAMVEAITECINLVDYRKGARAGWQSALAAAPGAQGDAA